jgi:Fic family protein
MTFEDHIHQIDALQQQIAAYGELKQEVKNKINYKFRLECNYTSNSMEGNSLTKQETRSVMVGNITVGGKPIKDVLEIKGHDEVISEILKIGKGELHISEKRIKDIHRGIMHEEDPEKKNLIGTWKRQINYLYNYKNERFDFAAPDEVPERMHQLVNWINAEGEKIQRKEANALHPVQLALKFHLDYVTIHPFDDGNGRTARILTNLILISYGFPPIYIKDSEKDQYYQYLGDIQGYGGQPDLFYTFMSGLVMRSQQLVLDAIEGKSLEEPDDLDKKIALLDKMLDAGGEEIEFTNTEEVVQKVLNEVAIPLFRKLGEKGLKFSLLFQKTDFIGVVNNIPYSHEDLEQVLTSFQERVINMDSITIVNFSIGLRVFKKLGKNPFNIFKNWSVEFDEFIYKVVIEGTEQTYLYHQRPTPEELEELANQFGNKILAEIEERVEAIQKKDIGS